MSKHHARLNRTRWQRARRAALERAGWRCEKCGGAGRMEADHVQPINRGGDPYAMGNLQALCRACHIEKTRLENYRIPGRREWRGMVQKLVTQGLSD